MLKHHILGGLLVLAGALFINHYFMGHVNNIVCVTTPCNNYDFVPALFIVIIVSLTVGFGIMMGFMRIKNVV